MQSVLAMGLKCVTGKTSICHFLDYAHRKRLFPSVGGVVFNSVIRLDGILFSLEGIIRRCKFAVIEQCFVWNLQRSCEELADFP